jgi:Domain of unknown function (DUF4365)
MTSKEINRESSRIFAGLLLPNWALRSQEDQEDYGVDSEIEITTPEDKATGFIFKIQLKGTSVAKYDEQGQLVYSDASVERFTYYISELRIPLIFVVCDIKSGDCFWTRVQGNPQLESALNEAAAKNQQTFTIKFPAVRQLQKNTDSANEVVDAVASSLDTITLRGLKSMSPSAVQEHIGQEPDIEETEKQFRLFAGVAAGESIRKMMQSGDFQAAADKAKDLLESESESPEIRLLGGLNLAHAYHALLRSQGLPNAAFEAAKVRVGIASRMLEVARRSACETRLKRYLHMYARDVRMHINGQIALALAMSEKVQALQGETIARPITHLERLQVSAIIAKDFFKLRNALYRLGSQRFFSVMPHALSDITESILPFVSSLRLTGRQDLADAYVNALFDFLPFCMGVVGRLGKHKDMVEIVMQLGTRFIGLADYSDKASMVDLLNRFQKALEAEPLLESVRDVTTTLRKVIDEVHAGLDARGKPSWDEVRAYYAQQAAVLGIDLNDPNDDIAKIVRLGLNDLDPTRVVKNCQHIHVMTTFRGIPAEMLGLPTAGGKRIVCLKHGHSVENLSLDTAYEFFAKTFPWTKGEIRCDNCPDKAPHPEGWEWSEEWNALQYERYQELRKAKASEEEDLPN